MKLHPILLAVILAFAYVPREGESVSSTKVTLKHNKKIPINKCKGKVSKSHKCQLFPKGIYYIGEIKVGSNGDKLKVVFDTGSDYIWLASSAVCSKNRNYCKHHGTYNRSRSSSLDKSYPPHDIFIGYADEGGVHGVMVKDTVTVGSLKVTGQIIVDATKFDGYEDEEFSGVIGLGIGKGETNFITNAVKQGHIDKAVFALSYNRKTSSAELVIGAQDEKHYVPPLIFLSTISTDSWTIQVDKLLVNGKAVATRFKANVDTGASHFLAPKRIVHEIHRIMNVDHTATYKTVDVDCKKIKTFPAIIFELQGHNFPLTPDDYILKVEGKCQSGFIASSEADELLLGVIWMEKYHTVFSMGKTPRVGFAKSK